MTTTQLYEMRAVAKLTSRRGVLLLVVLSMLTLFLMLGTAYLVVSTRSRETARAFAKLTMQSDSARIPHDQLLDAAFLRLIRGSGTTPTYSTRTSGSIPLLNLTLNSGTLSNANTTPPLTTVFESLLEDKYGSSVTGTVREVRQVPDSQLLHAIGVTIPDIDVTPGSGTANRPAGIHSTYDLAGRVVTILGPGREPTSHRVIRAELTSGQLDLWLDNPSRKRPFVSTGTTPTPIVVNGPEFSIHRSGTIPTPTKNEAWDGFDAENPFLTQIAPSATSVASSQVNKLAFIPPGTSTTNLSDADATGFPFGADNDGDGVLDGYFFDIGLPTFFMPNGDEIRIDVSAAIVDLDSRFNVNAHGSLAFNTYSTGSSNFHDSWARGALTSGSVPNLRNMPLGSGYGPPEVNASWMFPTSNYSPPSLNRTSIFGSNPAAGENPDMAAFAGLDQASQTLGRKPSSSRFTAGNGTLHLTNAEGRYGENASAALSGSSSVADLITSRNSTISGSTYSLARPGSPTVDDALSRMTDRCVNATAATTANGGIPPEWWDATAGYDWRAATSSSGLPPPRSVYNSPPDLHGRMITTSTTTNTSPVPMLAFAKPEWLGSEGTDDPYELRLDRKAARNVTLTTTGTTLLDNLFSIADLEPVLRPYDRDSLQLPPRLQALLGSVSEEARLRITTDSWDTTAVTGSAAATIRTWVKGAIDDGSFPNYTGANALTGLLGGEISRGERFNLNRPFTATKPAAYSVNDPYYKQRQAYFKDLYTLLVALGKPRNATTAQWAANVVEFRDADSTMTPFEFDTNPADGWDVDNDATTDDGSSRGRVWGAERPEVLITETSGWEDETTGELFVMLHRPWNAKAFSSGTTWIHGEPVDLELDSIKSDPQPMNLLDLGRKSADRTFTSGTAVYPIWRLRLVDAAGNQRFVRFDMTGSGTASDFAPSSVDAATTPRMGCDSSLCIMGNNSLTPAADVPAGDQVVSSGSSGRVVVTGSGAFRLPGATPAYGTLIRSGTVYLERLTDPRATVDNSAVNVWNNNPAESDVSRYTIVDHAPLSVVNRRKDLVTNQPHPAALPSVTRRNKSLIWKNEFLAPDTTAYRLQPSSMMGGSPRPMWFTWPNRPFVSSTELLLVPASDSLGMLQTYVKPLSPANLPALSSNVIPNGLFDAVHVPTRFSGIHTTVSATSGIAALEAVGIYSDTLSVNQLSSFREPGRVNLNTVTATDVWTAVVAGPLQTSGSAAPVRTIAQANFGTTPANGMHNILALSGAITLSDSGTSAPIQDTHPLLSDLQTLNVSHSIYTATRLANTATVRSNVFGLWITVRESVANDPDSIKLHRAFYIFDRSIPVAFEPGKDHNVWDAVLLRRIIQ